MIGPIVIGCLMAGFFINLAFSIANSLDGVHRYIINKEKKRNA